MKKIVLNMLKVLGIILIVILVNKNLEIAKQNNDYKIRDKILQSSVIVYVAEGTGSGTVINKTNDSLYILTCHHVIAPLSKNMYFDSNTGNFLVDNRVWVAYNIEKNKRIFYSAEVVALDNKVDLAILRITPIPSGVSVAPIAVQEPEIGDEAIVVGNPLGEIRNYSKQYITNKEKIYYVTNGLLTFGNSGGGLFNNAGELIGVPESVRMSPVYGNKGEIYWGAESSIGFSVDLPTIKKFLKDNGFENIYKR